LSANENMNEKAASVSVRGLQRRKGRRKNGKRQKMKKKADSQVKRLTDNERMETKVENVEIGIVPSPRLVVLCK